MKVHNLKWLVHFSPAVYSRWCGGRLASKQSEVEVGIINYYAFFTPGQISEQASPRYRSEWSPLRMSQITLNARNPIHLHMQVRHKHTSKFQAKFCSVSSGGQCLFYHVIWRMQLHELNAILSLRNLISAKTSLQSPMVVEKRNAAALANVPFLFPQVFNCKTQQHN